MNKRRLWFYSALIIFLVSLILLVCGSSILTISLNANNSLPLGTFITWAGIISIPLSIYWGEQKLRNPKEKYNKYLSLILKASLILAVLWLPICYLLAGNLSFSFTEKETFQGGQLAMRWFWRLSYGIAISPIAILIIHLILSFVARKNKSGD